ncbi:fumarylacetoacetate hydrolase family protein [Rubripirellula reticaptiva]|uniref:Ureidoglycolate lyase n=1 Tax=Rubripirellula reticaptiva TaxID=2528013 RepID=A0A5C6F7G9_9BACT|nr:fumarylacetoacetate hydrolase family protein [Rubripirellula reticaptiva]TWU56056.1 Ureidoglycolate lyase [Rubripirellula reticaptiva]
MASCRYINEDGKVEYAIYSDGKICPLPHLNDSNFFEQHPVFDPSGETWRNAPKVLLPPTPTPEKIICIGLNYRDHAIETGAEIPFEPVVFSKFGTALAGHGDVIRLPKVSSQVDYEAELVVVIGKTAKHVSAADAMDYVYGYSCGHDVSARDWQKGRPAGQWLLGKTFDTFAPVGPCVVAKCDLQDPTDLNVRMKLNDETVQNSTTAQLIFDIPALIAHLTKVMTLKPGDLIFTGTPPGVGAARKPPVFLKHGDVCSVEIEGIGMLTNTCRDE